MSGLLAINHTFEVSAVDQAIGQAVQPAQPYTITVHYTDDERGSVIETTLALYFWNGSQWVKEPSSVVNLHDHTVTAKPNHFSRWAVLGATHGTYLPIIQRSSH
jgi:hypothetical protein